MRKSSKRRLTNQEVDKLKDIENLIHVLKKEKKQDRKQYIEQPKVEVIEPVVEVKVKHWSDEIKLTPHCRMRANERFKMSKEEATTFFREQLKKAERIGKVINEHGVESYLYAIDQVAIIVSLDLREVRTVYKKGSVSVYEPIKNKLYELHKKELRKLERKEQSYINKLTVYKYEAAIEKAELKYRQFKTKSPSVEMACKARIKAIDERLVELENEINEIKQNKNLVAKSLVSVI